MLRQLKPGIFYARKVLPTLTRRDTLYFYHYRGAWPRQINLCLKLRFEFWRVLLNDRATNPSKTHPPYRFLRIALNQVGNLPAFLDSCKNTSPLKYRGLSPILHALGGASYFSRARLILLLYIFSRRA